MSRPKTPALSLRKPPKVKIAEEFIREKKANGISESDRPGTFAPLPKPLADRVDQHCKDHGLKDTELMAVALDHYFETLDRRNPPFDW
jgi:hypothetical protein